MLEKLLNSILCYLILTNKKETPKVEKLFQTQHFSLKSL